MAAQVQSRSESGKKGRQTVGGQVLHRVNDGNLISEDGSVLFSWDYDEKCWEIRFVLKANQRYERLKDALAAVRLVHDPVGSELGDVRVMP